MALNLVSPGVKIREVDLTIGRVDSINDQVGAIVGPFERGPVNVPVLISTEQELVNTFGKPQLTDGQNEYWLSASNYLSYGGVLRVVRSDSTILNNANSAVSYASTTLKIDNYEDYQNDYSNATIWRWASRNPGSWANNLKVCVIDSAADQKLSGINTSLTSVTTFSPITNAVGSIGITTTVITGISTSGIITGRTIRTEFAGVLDNSTTVVGVASTSAGLGQVFMSLPTLNITSVSGMQFTFGTVTISSIGSNLQVGYALTQALSNVEYAEENGDITLFNGTIRGVITSIGSSSIDVKITDRISTGGTVTATSYSKKSALDSFRSPSLSRIYVATPAGITTTSYSIGTLEDWYDTKTLGLTNSVVYWNSIAEKPGTSQYCLERNSLNDEIHVVIVDDLGTVTGISGNIIEKYIGISKALDARVVPSQENYYKNVIANNSSYIFPGVAETGTGSAIIGLTSSHTVTSGVWGTNAQNTKFNVIGAKTYVLVGGKDYSGTNNIGGYSASLADIISGYNLFSNSTQYKIDYIISGPSGGSVLVESQAKANALISIANQRKDCIAVISSHRQTIVNVPNSQDQTNNIIEFFEGLTSSSYAVFDSGYKYMFDRYNNKFDYVACNSDVAGLMARTSINNYPWYSPAGTARGSLSNVVKLAYNPNQDQRDLLYTKRINPIIASIGSGFILFGDKTALGYASAFDRINVRRLFLTLEKQIESAARSQLFEFNDIITRSNFINIVDPYLRDVQSKRGIINYQLICDESNNTPDVIDSNQFRADIYVQPNKSINFIGLTFVATRTGISFSEVLGTV